LSTATPAINAWMNPTHHVVVAAKTLVEKLNERICVVMACMMTEGPETSGIHNRIKVWYLLANIQFGSLTYRQFVIFFCICE